MKLFVIVLCLLSERYLIHSVSYQRFFWFEHYYLSIINIMDKYRVPNNASLMLALIVVPPMAVASFLYLLLDSILFGLLGFFINLALFFYCLGPQNPFYPLDGSVNYFDKLRVGTYLAKVNNQLFSVVFWYIVGGPIAALIFRLISLSENIPQVAVLAKD
jgi:AmpE protein